MSTLKKVMIQTQHGEYLTVNQYLSAYGFRRMGYLIDKFESVAIDDIKWDKNVVVHGGINTLHKIFKKLDIKIPEIHNPQDCLPQYCGNRNLQIKTLQEIYQMFSEEDPKPIFIKPAFEQKLFTGLVINSFIDFLKIQSVPKTTKVLCSDVIDILAEFRCYIFKGELVDAKNYTGIFDCLPNFDIIKNAIRDYKDAPIAYSLDFAVTTAPHKTVLIEINDMYGLGNYGINPILYCKMIEARWKEIIDGKK